MVLLSVGSSVSLSLWLVVVMVLTGTAPFCSLARAQPVNDNCTDAISFIPKTDTTDLVTGSTIGGNVGPGVYYCSQAPGDKITVFYSFEGKGTRITISTCSASTNFPTAIMLTSGCGLNTCITASDGDIACTTTANAAAITIDTTLSATYTVVIFGRQAGLEGNFGLTALEYIPPPNNLCTNAISVQPGSRTVGYTVNATVGPSLNVQPNTNVCPTVWYSVLGNGNLFKATTCSDMTDYNTAITVSSGCGSGLVSSNIDDSCSVNGGASAVSWNTTAGTRYNIAVHGRAEGDEGNFELIVMDMNNPVALGPVPRPTSTLPPPTTPPPMGLPTKVPASLTKAPITPRPLGQATTASPSKARVVVVAPTLSAAPLSAAPLPSAPMPFLAPATPVVQSLSGPNTPVESPVISPTRMRAPFPTVRIPYPIPCYPEIPKPLCYPTTAPGTQALPERNFLAASDAIHWSWWWGALLPALVGWIM